MTSNHNKQEPYEFDKELSDALFNQYQLGREHQRLADTGKKRKVGGEITDAKKAIEAAIAEHIIGKNKGWIYIDVPPLNDKETKTLTRIRAVAVNNKLEEQRNALYGDDNANK